MRAFLAVVSRCGGSYHGARALKQLHHLGSAAVAPRPQSTGSTAVAHG